MSIRRATYQDIVRHCDLLAQQDQRLRPGQSPLAALDADGTLWGPDIAELLWQRLVAQRTLDRRGGAALAKAVRECGGEPRREAHADYELLDSLYRNGKVPEETMVRAMLSGLAGLREEDLYLHAREVVATVRELNAPGDGRTRQVIDQLRAAGFRVIVVSGSPRWAVEVAVRPLGIEAHDVLAGQVAVVEGVLTEGIIEPLPWGKGKVQAFLRRFGAVPRVSMGNGLGDLPLLEATSHLRVLVNPTDELVVACEGIKGAIWSVSQLAPASGARRRSAVATAGGQTDRPSSRRPRAQT